MQHLVQLFDYVRRSEVYARACTFLSGEPFVRRCFMHHDIACDNNAIARYTGALILELEGISLTAELTCLANKLRKFAKRNYSYLHILKPCGIFNTQNVRTEYLSSIAINFRNIETKILLIYISFTHLYIL